MSTFTDSDDGSYDSEDWDDPIDEGWEEDDESDTIPCPFCKRDVYEDAVRCPHCEQYVENLTSPSVNQPKWVIWTACLLLLLFALGYLKSIL